MGPSESLPGEPVLERECAVGPLGGRPMIGLILQLEALQLEVIEEARQRGAQERLARGGRDGVSSLPGPGDDLGIRTESGQHGGEAVGRLERDAHQAVIERMECATLSRLAIGFAHQVLTETVDSVLTQRRRELEVGFAGQGGEVQEEKRPRVLAGTD